MKRWRSALAAGLGALGATGCAQWGSVDGAGYYWQSISGHVDLLQRARPVDDWLAAADTGEPLRRRLQAARGLRAYASEALALPDNASYRRYAELDRPSVVWNVVAAPTDSLQLKTWCFPVMGCVSYRGYFSEATARRLGERLAHEGWEVDVYGVPAYSTLGWTNWLGGDPLLSTFIRGSDTELARLMFHELAHQVVYIADDTAFNESFATAVERLGVAQWLAERGDAAQARAWAAQEARRGQWRALLAATRAQLRAVYEPNGRERQEKPPRAATKMEAYAEFRARYADLRARWVREAPPGTDTTRGGWARLDDWVARANNASLGAQGVYDDHVAAFTRLFERQDAPAATPERWRRFYDAVRQLGALPKAERAARLAELSATS